jgi:hypothetical protein
MSLFRARNDSDDQLRIAKITTNIKRVTKSWLTAETVSQTEFSPDFNITRLTKQVLIKAAL